MPEVDQHRALVAHIPAGRGECTIYWVDLDAGRDALTLALEVRAVRRRRDLATVFSTSEAECSRSVSKHAQRARLPTGPVVLYQ